jgi:single-stranded-DNA-specific exonuclease
MGKRWLIRPHDADLISHLERSASVSAVVAQLLLCRGIREADHARSFLDAKLSDLRDPDLLPGVTAAADRVHAAIQSRHRIVIYGDYDADGMTATALLYRCLKLLGADVGYYVPNRMEEGYGLNDDALRTLADRGTRLVITVDCGIASTRQALTAAEVGLELVVTDHHELGPELPQAAAIVHPRLPGSGYPFGGLCGAGVAFKLAWAICQRASAAKRVSPPMRQFLLDAVGLVALGTVADVVPLLDENRVLVRHGLTSLKRRPPLGLAALMKCSELDKKPALASEDLAFSVGPRLNAAGRLGQAQLAVELLITESADRAQSLAEYLEELNNSRKSLERSIYLAANKQAKERFDPTSDPALILAGDDWHQGVIGIVAGRLAEKYHRPVVLVSLDPTGVKPGTGSARTAAGIDLYAALAACREHLLGFGGHMAAAGLTIDRLQVDAFREALCDYVAGELTPENVVAELHVDAEAPLGQLTLNTVRQMELLAPFGQDNPRPLLCATGVQLAEPPRTMGGGDRHLSLRLRQGNVALRAVAFGHGDWAEELSRLDQPMDVAYRPVINHFRGRDSVELHLVDWRHTREPAAVE